MARNSNTALKSSYTLQFKMGVVEWVELNKSSVRAAAKKFGVDRKMVRSWLSSKERLKSSLLIHGPNKKKLHKGSQPLSYELDRQVSDYCSDMERQGTSVSDTDLRSRALVLAHCLGLTNFKATPSWLKRWKTRCRRADGLHSPAAGAAPAPPETSSTHLIADPMDPPSCNLSRVKAKDTVNLAVNQRVFFDQSNCLVPSCDLESDISYNDFTTLEHNYCRLDSNGTPPGSHSSLPHPDIAPQETMLPPATRIAATDLPLGNEVEIGNTEEIVIVQTGLADAESAGRGLLSVHRPAQELTSTYLARDWKPQSPKFKGRTSSTSSEGNARSTSPPFFHSLTLDPQGDGGLLASRLLQPVFPDEPEIVYLQMQLGMLHSLPLT